MLATLERITAFALYQLSLLIGLLLLPVALLVRRSGLHLPVGRLVERTASAYTAARDGR